MNNYQDRLLFPVRDAESQKEFLIACVVMLAGFIVPILPMLVLMDYSAGIMRQIVEEKKAPSTPGWRERDWSEMLLDGLRLWGTQIVLMLPLFLLMACAFIFIMSGSAGFAAFSDKHTNSFAPIAMLLFMIGFLFFGLFGVLSLPYGVIVSAALPHVAVKRSFQAAFEFKEWFSIFSKALGQFVLGYVIIMIAGFIFAFIMQIAMLTIVLICIIPLLIIPFSTYQLLVMNAVFAQAYAIGSERLEITSHATT